MDDLKLADDSTTGRILHSDVALLRQTIRGELVVPNDPGYDQARRVWNGMVDKRPAVVIYCAGSDDVITAVNFARARNLLVAVRAGGHNVAGSSVCDGGVVIDVSRMKSIEVDPVRRIARAQAGLNLGEFDTATQSHGLATTMGVNADTGIAGLTLGAGFGKLGRKYGLTCDNLLAAEIVTAGAVAIFETSGLERAVRDMHAAVKHVAMSPHSYIIAGRLRLRLDPGTMQF